MKSCKLEWAPTTGLSIVGEPASADLLVFFGPRSLVELPDAIGAFRKACPKAVLLGCSTGGQIVEGDVEDDRMAGLALSFDRTAVRLASVRRKDHSSSFKVGEALAASLKREDLAGVFILADGLVFDGAELVAGIASVVGTHVPLMGGLAGDGPDFAQTLVFANADAESGMAAAVGFYGASVRIGHGSAGGWDMFGPRRKISRSVGNVVYELDGKPALDLYERYLGEEAADLPASGLLFPLRIFDPANKEHDIVRTLLAIDRDARSVTFAGSMPEGWVVQLMRGSIDRMSEGATQAAEQARLAQGPESDSAAILVSCIGRRLLMGQRVGEEVEAVRNVLEQEGPVTGFYSYGEISPHAATGLSELHNQTMTVMTITEEAA